MDKSATITVRMPSEADLPELLSIWSEFVEMYSTFDYDFEVAENAREILSEAMMKGLSDEDTVILIAEIDGEIAGFLRGWIFENIPGYLPARKGFIHEIIVKSAYRGHHVGHELLRRAVDWFKERGTESIEVKISGKNSVARAFWGIEGFKEKQFVMELDLKEIA
jgi:ribosomal protein S18 acetylase RimI-like enzyme